MLSNRTSCLLLLSLIICHYGSSEAEKTQTGMYKLVCPNLVTGFCPWNCLVDKDQGYAISPRSPTVNSPLPSSEQRYPDQPVGPTTKTCSLTGFPPANTSLCLLEHSGKLEAPLLGEEPKSLILGRCFSSVTRMVQRLEI